jgi:predicted membrane metal-binding protein
MYRRLSLAADLLAAAILVVLIVDPQRPLGIVLALLGSAAACMVFSRLCRWRQWVVHDKTARTDEKGGMGGTP